MIELKVGDKVKIKSIEDINKYPFSSGEKHPILDYVGGEGARVAFNKRYEEFPKILTIRNIDNYGKNTTVYKNIIFFTEDVSYGLYDYMVEPVNRYTVELL